MAGEAVEGIASELLSRDMKAKLLGTARLQALLDQGMPVGEEHLPDVVKGLEETLGATNFKAAQAALLALDGLAAQLGDRFAAYAVALLPTVRDRLADSHDTVREHAQAVLARFATIVSLQTVADSLKPSLKHKNWRVREQVLTFIERAIERDLAGAGEGAGPARGGLLLRPLVEPVCQLLEDPQPVVREAAIGTLSAMHRRVGPRLMDDVRKSKVAPGRLAMLTERLADGAPPEPEPSRAPRPASPPPAAPAPQSERTSPAAATVAQERASSARRPSSLAAETASTLLDMKEFEVFDDCPPQAIDGGKDEVEAQLRALAAVIESGSKDWEQRVASLRQLRSFLNGGLASHEAFQQCLRLYLREPLVVAARDLRSSLAREACITVAHLAHVLGGQFDLAPHFVSVLIPLAASTGVRVVAEAAHFTLCQIIAQSPVARIVPVVCEGLTESRSSVQRMRCAHYLCLLGESWDLRRVERHGDVLQAALLRGVADSDAGARAYARRAFWCLARQWGDWRDAFLAKLDPAVLRHVLADRPADIPADGGATPSTRPTPRKMSAPVAGVDAGNREAPRAPHPRPGVSAVLRHSIGSPAVAARELETPMRQADRPRASLHGGRSAGGGAQPAGATLARAPDAYSVIGKGAPSGTALPLSLGPARLDAAPRAEARRVLLPAMDAAASHETAGHLAVRARAALQPQAQLPPTSTTTAPSAPHAQEDPGAVMDGTLESALVAIAGGDTAALDEALFRLARLSRLGHPVAWTTRRTAAALALAVKAAELAPPPGPPCDTRELSLKLVKEMLLNQDYALSTACVQPGARGEPAVSLAQVVGALHRAHRDARRDVLRAADEAAAALVHAGCRASRSGVPVLRELVELQWASLPAPDAPQNGAAQGDPVVLLAALKTTARALQAMDTAQDELRSLLPQLVEPLVVSFNHAAAEIRRATVIVLVQLYLILGEDVTPHLTKLNAAQMKLLAIYLARARPDADQPVYSDGASSAH